MATMQNTSENGPAPLAADDMLCAVARQWLSTRGWQGDGEVSRRDVSAKSDTGRNWLGNPPWTFDLGVLDGQAVSLRFRFPQGSAPELAEAALMQSYLRAALWMSQQNRDAPLIPRGDWVLAQRADVEKQLHDFGNRLNSLLANTAVLATVHRDDERLGRFATHAARDGDACAAMLASLSKMLLETRT